MAEMTQWEWDRTESDGSIPQSSLVAGKVLCRFWYDDMPPEGYLIAAAPDLLKACEEMLGALDDAFIESHDSGASIVFGTEHDPEHCSVCRVRAAIAKAKGEDNV